MKCLLWINFKEGTTEEEIQATVNSIYLKNQEVINGMEYNEFKDNEAHKEFRRRFHEFVKEK